MIKVNKEWVQNDKKRLIVRLIDEIGNMIFEEKTDVDTVIMGGEAYWREHRIYKYYKIKDSKLVLFYINYLEQKQAHYVKEGKTDRIIELEESEWN